MSESKKTKEELALERKQQQEQKDKSERLNMRLYGVIAAIILVAGIALSVYNTGIFQRSATAVTVNGTEYTAAEVQYFYNMELQNVATYAMYGLYDFDYSADPKDQIYDEKTGETWHDYFVSAAKDALVYITAMSDAAEQNGHTMSETSQKALDGIISSLDTVWVGNYPNRDAFLRGNYGPYMTYNKFVSLMEKQIMASDYVKAVSEGLEYDQADYDAYYAENADNLDTFTMTQFVLQAKAPTEGENGTELTDQEKIAAMEKQAAEKAAIAREIEDRLNKGEDPEVLAEEYKDELFSSLVSGERTGASISTASYNQWIFSADRKAGDVNLSEYVSTSVHNYYVVRFEGRELVESSTADVRHMLIAAGEGSDAANPTDAQYDEALKKAEALLDEWKKGEATEDSFAALATANTADTSSAANGGLLTGVSEASGYIQEFTDWCMDPARKSGDTGIVKNTGSAVKGWHIMYYVAEGDPVWVLTADNALRSADYTAWETEAIEGYEAVEDTGMKYV